MHHFQAVAYNNELWILGAFTGGYPHETPIPNIYIFNLEKNEWRVGPEIPADRRRGAAGVFVHNNKIFVVCGIQDGHWDGHVGWLDEYDPKTNQWKKLPDAPHQRDHVHAAVIDNKVYIAGGRRSTAKIGQVLNLTEPAVDVFDFKTNRWTTLPESRNIPTKRAGAASVALPGMLLVIGGESDAQVPSHSEVEVYNTITSSWERLPSLTAGRHGTGAAEVNGKIYIVAGSGNRGGGPELNSIEVLSVERR
jgi:N-acetylneuraminic acid mutarotase